MLGAPECREPLWGLMEERKAYRPKPRAEIARNMSAIRSTGNQTETALRKALFRLGYRYRKYSRDLVGRPDIVFPTEKVAVFVDGDYWHGRVLAERGPDVLYTTLRTENRGYWMNKFQRRVARDREVTEALRADGWHVLRLWESDVKRDLQSAVETVAAAVLERRQSRPATIRRSRQSPQAS